MFIVMGGSVAVLPANKNLHKISDRWVSLAASRNDFKNSNSIITNSQGIWF
jgi:hypothetical protein